MIGGRRFLGFLFLSLFGATIVTEAARSEDTTLWKHVDSWQVRVDTTLNYGCFIMAEYEQGSVLRIGFDPSSDGAYLLITNERWRSIEQGKEYTLVLQFDDKDPWEASAQGFKFENSPYPFLYTPFSEAGFFKEFMRSHELTIEYRRERIASLSLRGSFAATREMVNCQRQIDETRSTRQTRRNDPFAPRARGASNDPFAR
jgi:hypothetical protein